MGTIVAIGGGDIGLGETLEIDRQIIGFSGKTGPNALFIPTASSDSRDYYESFRGIYGTELGCNTDALYLLDRTQTPDAIAQSIAWADIIYVGGGNTLRMMQWWRRLGVDSMLLDAYKQGKVLSGLSAGALCWFRYAHSDSRMPYIRVSCLGIINATCCPHFTGGGRQDSFEEMIRKRGGTGIALDDNCAIAWHDGKPTLLKSQDGAKAYILRRRLGQVTTEIIEHSGQLPRQMSPHDIALGDENTLTKQSDSMH